MQNDTIYINNEIYRIEFNWNALVDFIETEGLKLSQIDKLEELAPRLITSLFYSGVKEGARMEGKPFPYTKEDIGAHLSTTDVAKMITIYRRQSEVSKMSARAETTKKKTFQFLSRK